MERVRKEGFTNELIPTLAKVVDKLCDTINGLAPETIKSITGREWILSIV
jgi:hypothetical protein